MDSRSQLDCADEIFQQYSFADNEHPSANVEASRNSARVRPYEVSGQKSPFFDHEATQNYSFEGLFWPRSDAELFFRNNSFHETEFENMTREGLGPVWFNKKYRKY